MVEWSENNFSKSIEADNNVSMTIYDILCYSKEDCSLSGNYCPVIEEMMKTNFSIC